MSKQLQIVVDSQSPLIITSIGGKGSIIYKVSTENGYPSASVLLDWLNLDCIKLATVESTGNSEEGKEICKELVKMTNKFEKITVYPNLSEVCLIILF